MNTPTVSDALERYNRSTRANQRREYLELSAARVTFRQSFWLAGFLTMMPVAYQLEDAIEDNLEAICDAVFGRAPEEEVDAPEVLDWMLSDHKFGYLVQIECPNPHGDLVSFWLYHESIDQLVQNAIAIAINTSGKAK